MMPPLVMDAMPVLLLLQVPPVIAMLMVADDPIHAIAGPDMGNTIGVVDTLAVPAMAEVHPELLDAITVYIPGTV